MELKKIKRAYFIGIKGVGMTMLAQSLHDRGVHIFGSDVAEDFATTKDTLLRMQIEIKSPFLEQNVPSDVDLIVYSSAYNSQNNPEVAKAVIGKTRAIPYAVALSELFNQNFGIAVAGTHGKTTTSAWLGYVLDRSGLQPSVLTGTYIPQFNGAALTGASDYFVMEADEYQNKLQYLRPRGVLLNNVEYDHPDYFSTEEAYQQAFTDFVKKIPPKGFLVVNFDDEFLRTSIRDYCVGRIISYGIDNKSDFEAYDIQTTAEETYFKVRMNEHEGEAAFKDQELNNKYLAEQQELGTFHVKLLGQHNISNALAVIATAVELGVELVDIRRHLAEFSGAARRMQYLGEFRQAPIIDDYAHHPTEILATLSALRQRYPSKRLVAVFHPHTFSRTKALLADFAESFGQVDELIVLDIFGSAREQQGTIHSSDLIKTIEQATNKPKAIRYIPTLEEATIYLRGTLRRNDVLALLGAGDAFRIGEDLIK